MRSSCLAWTILRPSGFNQNFSEDFLLPGIVQADTIATDQRHAGKTYVLTGPLTLTFAQAATVISRVAGRTITHVPMSSDALHDVLVTAGLPPRPRGHRATGPGSDP